MAPEIFEGTVTEIGPEMDVWAMGIILFTLVFDYALKILAMWFPTLQRFKYLID